MLRGSRICHLQICHFGMWIVLSWWQLRPSRLRKTFYLSLNCLKESYRGPVPERAITRDNFLYQKDVPAWHGKHLLTNHLLFSSSCEVSSLPLKPYTPTSFSLAWDSIYASIARLLWVFMSWWGSCKYVIKLNFLPLICFMSIQLLDQPKKSRREIVSSPKILCYMSTSQDTMLLTQFRFLLICEGFLYSSRSS